MADLSKLEVSSIKGGPAVRTSPGWQGALELQGVPARRDLSVWPGGEGWDRTPPCPTHWGGRDEAPDREEALRGCCGGRSPLERGRGEWGGGPPGPPPSWPGRDRPGAVTAPWWMPGRGTGEKAELSPMTR